MKRLFPILLTVCLSLALAACAAEQGTAVTETAEDEAVSVQVFAMDTYIDLTAYGPNAEAALDEIAGEIETLDGLLSVTDENSEVYALNHADGAAVSVSETTRSLIAFTQTLSAQCGGALDISVYPLALAWGFTTEDYRVPTDAGIADLLALVDESQIVVDDEAGTVTLPAGMEIDLGAVGKGYACDLAREILAEYGVEHALLNFGSSTICLYGDKPDGSRWRVAVQDPEDDSTYAGILELEGCVVDTSGGYERYFTDEDGTVYWHILDPETGRPADSGLISATIVSESGLNGDALSTACFVMGLDKSIDYWRTYGGFEFVFITEAHEIYVSEGIADSFTPVYDYEDAEITVVSQ
ncbi:MAG: FAD:protein FMN transferase [Oscillospiraceae bacterium]|nr:FAD:protein FMN transferase [Oscillospiraceae bacterium]